jgi:hypothetical protein
MELMFGKTKQNFGKAIGGLWWALDPSITGYDL